MGKRSVTGLPEDQWEKREQSNGPSAIDEEKPFEALGVDLCANLKIRRHSRLLSLLAAERPR